MRIMPVYLLIFIAFNKLGFGLHPVTHVSAGPQSALAVPLRPMLPESYDYQPSQNVWHFDDSPKSYSITSTIEHAPDSYFEKAKTVELYDPEKEAWIKVDKWALTRFKEAGFIGLHVQELLSLNISLEKAAQLIVQFTEEGLVNDRSSADEILDLIRFETEFLNKSYTNLSIDSLACGFRLNFEGGMSFAKARKLLELEIHGLDDSFISELLNMVSQKKCSLDGKCDFPLSGSGIIIDWILSGTKEVFKVNKYPQFIFKIMREKKDGKIYISDSFNKRILGKKVAEDNKLDALIFPQFFMIDVTNDWKKEGDEKVILVIEEMLPIRNHSIYQQEELFKKYGDALHRALAQFVTFMLKTGGMGDLHRSNLLILDNPTEQGNYQFGLIDLDHLTQEFIRGLTGNFQDPVGYYGYPHALASHHGVLHFAATEGQIKAITDQLYQELGWPKAAAYLWLSDYHTAVKQQQALIERERRLKQFHEERGLTDNGPLEVSLADIGLGFMSASRNLEGLLRMNADFMEEFTDNLPQFTDNRFKSMFGNLTDMIAKIKLDTDHLKDSYANLVNDNNFTSLEKRFDSIIAKINEVLKSNGKSGLVKQDRFVQTYLGEDELTLMLLGKLQEYCYIFDFIHNGWTYIQL